MFDPTGSPEQILAYACGYPFTPPDFSFRFVHDRPAARPLTVRRIRVHQENRCTAPLADIVISEDGGDGEVAFRNRVPIIAAGSNASFKRLSSKFSEAGMAADFPVVRARVSGLVSVYSAHVSKYGSVPGTLIGEAGAESLLHIAFVDRAALERLNRSEAVGLNYALALIGGVRAECDGHALDAVLAYVSKRGAFAPDGEPVRIAAFASTGSRYRAAPQSEILGDLQAHVGHKGPLAEFVHSHVTDEDLRRRRTGQMQRAARPCVLPGLHTIAGGLEAPPARLPDGF